jgi:O-antigen ligase
MGFALSILYFVTYYLSPPTLFGPLAVAHVQLIIAALVTLISLPTLARSSIRKTPQAVALIGLSFTVLISSLVAVRWAGGAVQAFLGFIPNAFGYFLVCLYCDSMKKLKILILSMLLVCLFVIARGSIEISQESPDAVAATPAGATDYALAMNNDNGEWFLRLKGQGNINDPNDFAQLIACTIPLIFIFWRPKKSLLNLICVIVPVCMMLVGAFLTHSRGGILALVAVLLVATRRRIGTVPAVLLTGGLLAGALALQFTGGRSISASAGQDRTALWGEGMELLKAHPLFGVGLNNMTDAVGQTAHNSVVVCAAELGLLGLYFWALFLFPSVRDALVIASPEKISEGKPIEVEEGFFPSERVENEYIDKADLNRMGRLLFLSLTGFLVAAWFLSRSFVLTLFLLGGMVEVVFEMGLQRGMIAPLLPLPKVLLNSGVLAVSLLVVMYISIRILNLMH